MLCHISEAAENFHYTNQGDAVDLEDVSDSDEFAATQEALSLLGLSAELQRSLLRVLSAILHLGNITIIQKNDDSQIKVGSNCINKAPPKQVLKSLNCKYLKVQMCNVYICICDV